MKVNRRCACEKPADWWIEAMAARLSPRYAVCDEHLADGVRRMHAAINGADVATMRFRRILPEPVDVCIRTDCRIEASIILHLGTGSSIRLCQSHGLKASEFLLGSSIEVIT